MPSWLKWRRSWRIEHTADRTATVGAKRHREELINQLILRENSTESLRSMAAYLGIDSWFPRKAIIELSQPDREALRNVGRIISRITRKLHLRRLPNLMN